MKKLILTIAVALIAITSFAQSGIFDKFEDMDDVTTVVVSKDAFRMLSKFKGNSPEAAEYGKMVENLESLKVFTTENPQIANMMTTAVTNYLKTSKLTELMRVKDKDAHVKIYVRPGKDEDHVKELLMFVNNLNSKSDKQAVILSLTGNIDLNKISEITDAHIPNSGKELGNK